MTSPADAQRDAVALARAHHNCQHNLARHIIDQMTDTDTRDTLDATAQLCWRLMTLYTHTARIDADAVYDAIIEIIDQEQRP